MKHLKNIGIVCVWIALWALAAWAIGSPIILASPLETAAAFAAAVTTPAFWMAIGGTLWHIAVGLVAACVLGSAMGIAAARWRAFGAFISPAMHFVKSAPIVCFIVLMLVWFGSTYVDLAAVLLAVMPVYFFSLNEAYRQRDSKLIEMLRVFRVPLARRIRLFEWPSVLPFFTQSTKVAVGMSWKSGVTAELIGLTFSSIGEQIYAGKLTLDTASLLMWTIVIVLLSWAFEKAILALMAQLGKSGGSAGNADDAPREVRGVSCESALAQPVDLHVREVGKSFDGQKVLYGFSHDFRAGSRTCIMAPTGTGKTTLLNIILGIERPDGGSVRVGMDAEGDMQGGASRDGRAAFSAVFQEARLLEEISGVQNVSLIAPASRERAAQLVGELLEATALDAVPSELSGGMKRCVEICRALAAPSNCVIMDEPFAGLDVVTKQQAIGLIERELAGRTLILVTHDRTDAEALGCGVIELDRAAEA